MKTISSLIIIMAMASLFGGVSLWLFAGIKIVSYLLMTYGCLLMAIHIAMEDKIQSMEMEIKNRNLYK